MDMESSKITVSVTINAPISKVWEYYKSPEHNIIWNTGHPSWHTPHAEIDLREGGKFLFRMEARDGSAGFDFIGTYTKVVEHELIHFVMEDGREAEVIFRQDSDQVMLTEVFDPENMNSREIQQSGWQGILDNFKNYVENN
jgi:uncharacterized protein YndB with AHSA1/START domain